MQPSELSDILILKIINVLKECTSNNLVGEQDDELICEKWVLSTRKINRSIECRCSFFAADNTINLILNTDDWSLQYLFLYNQLINALEEMTQIEFEEALRNEIVGMINEIDKNIFEVKNNTKSIKRNIIDDIKSFYSDPSKTRFDYENNCGMDIYFDLLNMALTFFHKAHCIAFFTLDGTSPFTPFLSDETLCEHEILINRGYGRFMDDITRNYKNESYSEDDNQDCKNDIFILNWFNSKISENGLCNIFKDIEQYVEITAQRDNVKNILKCLRQDLRKIFFSIENIFYLEELASKETEFVFLKKQIGQDRKTIYQGNDIEFIFIKYRSILDYSIELIKGIFPETEGSKLQGKFEFFSDVMKGNSDFDKYILSSNWYQAIKLIRDNVIHHGATCLVYEGNILGFQIYDMYNDNMLVNVDDYMKVNENIVRIDRYLLVNLAYLYYFLDICFKAITNKIYKSSNKDHINKKLDAQKEIMTFISERYDMNEEMFCIPISKLLKNWCNDLLKEIC